MARVDFYVLNSTGELSRQTFACRLAEKAWRLSHSVHIQTAGRQEAGRLDELLWTFRDGSFVPHELVEHPGEDSEAPITIAFAADSLHAADLLINLTDRIPQELGSFPRVAEIVTSEDERRRHGRKLFAEYRSQGHSLETHKL
ncbi:MAG: DNA polymerase III subunit chi [Woeseiaceae bacterium]